MPTKKILVATDFSESANIAVQHALEIARQQGAELVLLHVGDLLERPAEIPPQLLGIAAEYEHILKERLATVREQLAALRERIDGQGVTISQTLINGLPGEAIPKAAKEIGAHLLIVGTQGLTGFRRFFLGSVAEQTIRNAQTTTLVVRGTPPQGGGYHNILVPVDFSAYSKPTLKTAVDMAAKDAKIDLFYALQLPGVGWGHETWGPDWKHMGPALREAYKARADELIAQCSGRSDLKLAFHQHESSPAAGIQTQLDEGKYDLVVMGSHGHRGVKRWILGSVANTVTRHAPCSVVVVHKTEQKQ